MSEAVVSKLRDAVRTIQALRGRVSALQAERNPPIAIIGMACRFAGAPDVDALWHVLSNGTDTVRSVPGDRWNGEAWFSSDPEAEGRIAFREAAFLDDVDSFDNGLFGIASREAAGMDPQHRLLLELAWSALEHAAIRPDGLGGTATGVFLGLNGGDHMLATLSAPEKVGTHALAGAVGSIGAGRIAYALGLNGPAMVVDTACSSSLVAVHLAVQALRRGECAMALAGGMHLMLAPNVSVALSRARMMAPDGRCKAFDATADGFGQGEGGGLVVLKRLSDARADGDRVLAVVGGSALNQDGRSAGITAPNQRAQEAVIRAALADADLSPDAIDAIEAHGTGTRLGDPLELHALASVFRSHACPLPIGSIKTNIGHTAAAAGIAGLIKAVLMLRHQSIPPSVHFRDMNPHVTLDGVPIVVPTSLQEARLRSIGVSSFGFSGTNAHIVVRHADDAPADPASIAQAEAPADASRVHSGLLLSARTPEALQSLVRETSAALSAGLSFQDACHTAWRGRPRFGWWVWVTDPAELPVATPREDPIPDLPAPAGGSVGNLPVASFHRQLFSRVAAADPGTTTTVPPAASEGFPGRLIDSPSADRQLACVLDLAAQPWLRDHQVQGRVIVPGAVMIALLLAVAPEPADALANVAFVEPVLMNDEPVRLVAIGRPDGTLAVGSRSSLGWTWHATAHAAHRRPVVPAPNDAVADEALSRTAWIERLARLGIAIGPNFQAIRTITLGPCSSAMLDDRCLDAPVAGPFHPALLDAVLQVAGGTLPPEPVLPVGIRHISFHAPLTGALTVTAHRTDDAITLHAEADDVAVVDIEGLAVRKLSESLPPIVAALEWRAMPAPDARGERPAVIAVGAGTADISSALSRIQRQLHDDPRPIVLMTHGAGDPVTDPDAGAFVGLARALAEERPELRCRCIDVAPGTPMAHLDDELSRVDGESVVSLRPDGRFVPRLVPLPQPTERLRLRGTVLITGGLGGIGRLTAGWALARGAEAVLLVNRSGGEVPAELAAHRARIHTLACDITATAAGLIIRQALTDLPPLRTVIHAAGILRDGLIEDLTPEAFAESMAPKLGGAHALHALTADLPLDHFLLFGSVASLIGAAGQANYAASNAALDAFAGWRRARGLPATSIAWGRWSGVGMAAGLTEAQTARVAARGVLGMTPSRALQALDGAVLSGAAVVMIAALDPARLAEVPQPVFADLTPALVPDDGPVSAQVAAVVTQILGQTVSTGRPLVACGLDSLMAMDLRNRLNRRFGIGLGIADLMGGADIAEVIAAVEGAMTSSVEMEEMTL
jgi:acyl transferase domain-containing protein/aryl carrier-like protein